MNTIFIVDDTDTNLTKAKQALEDKYRVLTMPSASKMFALLEKIIPDLILLDIEMPEMDGFTALKKLKENKWTAKIPIVFLTAQADATTEIQGFELGAVDFITKPFSRPVLLNRIAGHLHISDLIDERTEHVERLQNGIISVLADMVEERDRVTGGHVERTAVYVKILLIAMLEQNLYTDEIKKWDCDAVVSSARLHDVGKITISDALLNKPGKLNAEEFSVIKTHAEEGEKIIDRIMTQTVGDVFLSHAKIFAGSHHERWNGAGYPKGLKGEEIPLEGRIMALVDVYDALVSERPYKKALPYEEAESIIMSESGKHFDPKIVKVFFDVKEEFKKAHQAISS